MARVREPVRAFVGCGSANAVAGGAAWQTRPPWLFNRAIGEAMPIWPAQPAPVAQVRHG